MAESACFDLIKDSNRPYNVQGVADMLASRGYKKGQVEKTLAGLAESGKIVCKEFGKQKLYIPNQENLPTLSTEAAGRALEDITSLQNQCKEEDTAISSLKKDVSGLDSTMTIEELESEIAKQKKELDSVNERLGDVKSEGRKLVSAEDIIQSELLFKQALGSWERYRHSFRSIWDLISENLEDNQADIFDQIGVETDESVGEVLQDYQRLLPAKRLKV